MDFSVIRPKPPLKKPDPSPPPPVEKPPPPPPQPHGGAPPPYGPFTLYMEELQHMERLKSVEYSNSRFWKMNFDEYPYQQQFGSSEYHHYPVGGGRGAHNHNHPMPPQQPCMGHPPPHDHHHAVAGPPPRLGLPAPDHHHHGPPQRLGLPPVDHHHGPPTRFGPPPRDYHYGPQSNLQYGHAAPPHYGGLFSDENPNGCMIM